MTTFVDTSALYALLDEDDPNHVAAVGWLSGPGRDPQETLVTHSYAVIESAALVHRRLGVPAVRVLLEDFVPNLSVLFVDQQLHRNATSAYLAGIKRGSSLVDRVSFEMMREQRIRRAFAFDRDFHDERFETAP